MTFAPMLPVETGLRSSVGNGIREILRLRPLGPENGAAGEENHAVTSSG